MLTLEELEVVSEESVTVRELANKADPLSCTSQSPLLHSVAPLLTGYTDWYMCLSICVSNNVHVNVCVCSFQYLNIKL